jgi:alkanesulfonate monooxygenase SsuD/methylene tetrahydromethanopterin reductase-like flavin-dependent oxidoreductase (luciferase family)
MILDSFSVSDLLGMAVDAEEAGYDSVWVGDSLLSKPRLDPLTTMAAISSQTTSVKIGTSTLVLPLRNQYPLILAHAWASLDAISGGRTIFGVGIGGGHPRIEDKLEFEMVGVPYESRGKVFEEGLELVKKLWTEDDVTFHGKFHNVEKVTLRPKPVQKPHPPIWIANAAKFFHSKPSTIERVLRRTARLGDGFMSAGLKDSQAFGEELRQVNEFRKEYKKPLDNFSSSYQVTLNISDDSLKSRNDMLEFLERYYFLTYTDEQLIEWGPHGNASKLSEWFDSFSRAGCENFVVRFASLNQQGQFEKFTKEVLPSLH